MVSDDDSGKRFVAETRDAIVMKSDACKSFFQIQEQFKITGLHVKCIYGGCFPYVSAADYWLHSLQILLRKNI